MTDHNFERLMNMIMEALADERAAGVFYGRMANIAPDYDSKEAFLEASRDEKRHAIMVRDLIKELTGVEPPGTMEQVPQITDFVEGLRRALEGEEADIATYTNIINMSGIESVRRVFRLLRDDEMVHAGKFRMLLQMMTGQNRVPEEVDTES